MDKYNTLYCNLQVVCQRLGTVLKEYTILEWKDPILNFEVFQHTGSGASGHLQNEISPRLSWQGRNFGCYFRNSDGVTPVTFLNRRLKWLG